MPPGNVDPTKSYSNALDYFDESYGFGHSTYITIQKSGKQFLPVSLYYGGSVSLNGMTSAHNGVTKTISVTWITKFQNHIWTLKSFRFSWEWKE